MKGRLHWQHLAVSMFIYIISNRRRSSSTCGWLLTAQKAILYNLQSPYTLALPFTECKVGTNLNLMIMHRSWFTLTWLHHILFQHAHHRSCGRKSSGLLLYASTCSLVEPKAPNKIYIYIWWQTSTKLLLNFFKTSRTNRLLTHVVQ